MAANRVADSMTTVESVTDLEAQRAEQNDNPQASLALEVIDAEPDVLRDELDALNPDELSPREALDALYRLKNL